MGYMKEFIVDSKYYDDIQLIIGIAIKRYRAKDILKDRYAEMTAILKGVKHRNELAYSPNIEEITIRLNGNELWALKLAVDDLISYPSDQVSVDTLRILGDYLKQFDVIL